MQTIQLADIKSEIPDAILDIRYASTNNITGRQLYKEPQAFLRHEVLDRLRLSADELRSKGYLLVIFDAYRPPAVQDSLRKVCADSNYVAEISNHCRGITIDVSLATLDGKYLDMGTDHDDFTAKAHATTNLITEVQQTNRDILFEALRNTGFYQHAYEWWHFDYQPTQDWEVINSVDNVI